MLKLFETIKGYDYSSSEEFEKHKTYMESKGYKVLDTVREFNVYYFNNGYIRVYYTKQAKIKY
jgi:hypothetical protein